MMRGGEFSSSHNQVTAQLLNNTITDNEGRGISAIAGVFGSDNQIEVTMRNNLVTGNTIHTDGPIGNELSPVDITPAFLGGIVLLNGTYNNLISNNQTWASFGADLAWAQAVPDSSSAIGVKTYAPPLHCNVSVYDGSGSAPPLNGNVWTGNTYHTIDPCLPAQ